MNFEFGRQAKVVVAIGGKLILNGTTFSGLPDCNTLWQGVEVEGTTAYTQSTESNQGVFEMKNDSYIKNAKVGLYVAKEVNVGIYEGGETVWNCWIQEGNIYYSKHNGWDFLYRYNETCNI